MKAKRRQELHTNDLAQALDTLRQSFHQWGVYLLGGVAVVLAVYAISTSIQSARKTQVLDAYKQLQQAGNASPENVPKSDDDLLASLDTMKRLAEESASPDFKLDATHQRAEFALGLALQNPEGPQKEFLEKARESFEKLISDYSDRKVYVGRAHYGLFQVEAQLFAIDGDPSHKAVAQKHLEAIRDDPAFVGTPLMSAALDRLNEIDALFTKIEFEKAPPPPQPPTSGETIKIPVTGSKPEASVTIEGVVEPDKDSETGDPAPEQADDVGSDDIADADADVDSEGVGNTDQEGDVQNAEPTVTDEDIASTGQDDQDDAETPQP